MLYISYSLPGAETYPDNTFGSSRRPCPNSVSLLTMAPRLKVQLFQRIASLNSMFCDRYLDSMALVAPADCAKRLVDYLLADKFGHEPVDDLRN